MDKKVEIESLETVHAGFYPKVVVQMRYRRFDGSMSNMVSRDVLIQGGAAVVLPYDPAADLVLLIEQFRPGPMLMGDDPWTLETVAGRIEAGEDPGEAACREAAEEASVEIQDLAKIADAYPSPGCLKEKTTLFIGRCTLAGKAAGVHGVVSEDEDIRTHIVSFDQAMKMADDGRLKNMPTLLALFWLAGRRDELRRRWS